MERQMQLKSVYFVNWTVPDLLDPGAIINFCQLDRFPISWILVRFMGSKNAYSRSGDDSEIHYEIDRAEVVSCPYPLARPCRIFHHKYYLSYFEFRLVVVSYL